MKNTDNNTNNKKKKKMIKTNVHKRHGTDINVHNIHLKPSEFVIPDFDGKFTNPPSSFCGNATATINRSYNLKFLTLTNNTIDEKKSTTTSDTIDTSTTTSSIATFHGTYQNDEPFFWRLSNRQFYVL